MHVPKLNNSHYTSFKAIYFERGKYSEPQQETMKDIVNKLRTKDPSDSSGLTYEAKLKNAGLDVFVTDSILKKDSVDLSLISGVERTRDGSGKLKYNKNVINVGTYNKEAPFDLEDISTARKEHTYTNASLILIFLAGLAATIALGISRQRAVSKDIIKQEPTKVLIDTVSQQKEALKDSTKIWKF